MALTSVAHALEPLSLSECGAVKAVLERETATARLKGWLTVVLDETDPWLPEDLEGSEFELPDDVPPPPPPSVPLALIQGLRTVAEPVRRLPESCLPPGVSFYNTARWEALFEPGLGDACAPPDMAQRTIVFHVGRPFIREDRMVVTVSRTYANTGCGSWEVLYFKLASGEWRFVNFASLIFW